ncbi:hypothetical protein ACFQV4_12085 [Streptomyces thermocarboxydus]
MAISRDSGRSGSGGPVDGAGAPFRPLGTVRCRSQRSRRSSASSRYLAETDPRNMGTSQARRAK